MKRLKSECTPEEWATHLEYHRLRRLANKEREQARLREYNARPEVKARRAAHDARPEVRAKRTEYAQSEGAKTRAKELREQLKADPERWGKRLERQRVDRTGVDAGLFAKLLAFQGNRCAVCLRAFDGRQVRADHCHDTKTPRGLLCHHCNIVEGMLRGMQIDPVEFGHRLASYLKKPPASSIC